MQTPLNLNHLLHLTDDVGVIQHAIYNLPRRVDGYATDDNARALVFAAGYFSRFQSEEARKLALTCLAFVQHSQARDGEFQTFMTYDRRLKSIPMSEDCHARCLWAAAETMASKLPEDSRTVATEIFERGLHHIHHLRAPRAVGIYLIALAKAWAADARNEFRDLSINGARYLVQRYRDAGDERWRWFEDAMTYANARIPHGLFCAGALTGEREFIDLAEESLLFLDRSTNIDGVFVPVGNHGWLDKNGARAMFDQQPLEAGSMVDAAAEAFKVTGKKIYLEIARRAFDWFAGINSVNEPVALFEEGSCCDGIQENGLNRNKGAEATISFLLAALSMIEIGLPLRCAESEAVPRPARNLD